MVGEKNDFKPKQKKEKGRKKGKEGKEKGKKGKGKEGKRERKRGKRKEIGKKKEKYGFWLTQENKENLFGKKNHIFSPGGKNIIYFRDVNVFKSMVYIHNVVRLGKNISLNLKIYPIK